MSKRIYLSPPHLSGEEMPFVQSAFADNWVAPAGPNIDNFELAISKYTGTPNVLAVNSGTAAIHLALLTIGVGPGDEVICPTLTFIATANPVVYCGATPIFVDSEPETWNMSPAYLEQAIKNRISKGKKPKAILLVHLLGNLAQVEKIAAIAERYGIALIEDAADALGSTHKNKKAGTWGRLGIFSFNGNKIITTSGGGALISQDKALIDKARYLATQAKSPYPFYHHEQNGFNYRMSNILAGIGIGQMSVLENRIQKRRSIFDFYKSTFCDLEAISFSTEAKSSRSNRWLSALLIDPKYTFGVTNENIRLALEAENIESRLMWKPMHLQPVFSHCLYFGEGVAEHIFQQGLCLPSGSSMSEEDLNRVAELVKKELIVVMEK